MSNIKSIVKVMNFQALLHVDQAHRTANKYFLLEKDIDKMISIIENNRNLILDKNAISVNEKGPRLRYYIGSDLGFCGVINASVNKQLALEDGKNDIVIIGKKIHTNHKTLLEISRNEFEDRFEEVSNILINAIKSKKYSGIDVFYNKYINMTNIEATMKTIFPLDKNDREENEDDNETYNDDFWFENGDVIGVLSDLTASYLKFELRSAIISSYASENILRQQATNQSLKHIDELEAIGLWKEHKRRESLSVSRIIDSYTKLNYRR